MTNAYNLKKISESPFSIIKQFAPEEDNHTDQKPSNERTDYDRKPAED